MEPGPAVVRQIRELDRIYDAGPTGSQVSMAALFAGGFAQFSEDEIRCWPALRGPAAHSRCRA
jgi:hypothetical protein